MDGNYARFRNMVDENGGILPFTLSRCWERIGARDKTGRPKFWLRDNQGQSGTIRGQFGNGAEGGADPDGQDAAAR